MKTMLAIALTVLSWGIYGPVLHWGQGAMDHSRLLPFICVGMAYFLIAVIAPAFYLRMRGEVGEWTASGTIWSLAAGAAGAVGALGIIMAFAFHGRPIFVMPLVFGGAPVVNSFLTMYMSKTYKQVGPIFVAGLILVIVGAATVLIFKPTVARAGGPQQVGMTIQQSALVLVWIAVVVLNWGAYGPVLHKGQMKMAGSRLRPLMCVGLAYFGIAVVVPLLLWGAMEPDKSFTFTGSVWSLAAGAAGAIGALGIILAFNFGGKPIYVMPLVFGGAPVVNTFFSMAASGARSSNPIFYAGLILVVAGAVIVLVFAPRGHGPPSKPEPESAPAESKPAADSPAS